jgi:hypothetical protein
MIGVLEPNAKHWEQQMALLTEALEVILRDETEGSTSSDDADGRNPGEMPSRGGKVVGLPGARSRRKHAR